MAGPIAYFEVQWRPSDDDTEWKSMTVGVDTTVVTITGVDRTRAYSIRARSVGPTGLKSIWVDISHTVDGNAVPDIPMNMVARNVIDGVRLDWEFPKVQDANTETSIERALIPAGPWTHAAWVRGNTAIIPESEDGTYYYRARTRNYAGYFSNYSAVVSGRPIPNDLPTKVLEIIDGVVTVDCFYKQFYLLLDQPVTSTVYINVSTSDTIIWQIEQGGTGGNTINLGPSVIPISGIPYVPTTTVGAVDVLGFNTTNSGVTWRMTAQKPNDGGEGGGGSGSLVVTIAPSPASNSVEVVGGAPIAPSITVTATVAGGTAPFTHNWTRADSGGTNFLIDDATLAAPTFSIPAAVTAFQQTQQWRDTVTDAGSLVAQRVVDITLTRIVNALSASFDGKIAEAFGIGMTGPSGGNALLNIKSNGMWETWEAMQVDGTWYPANKIEEGQWHGSGPVAGIGSEYQVKFTPTGSGGTLSNGAPTFTTIGAGQSIQLQFSRSGLGAATVSRSVLVEIQKISDTGVNVSGTITLTVTGENS